MVVATISISEQRSSKMCRMISRCKAIVLKTQEEEGKLILAAENCEVIAP